MQDIAIYVRWRDFVGLLLLAVVVLVVAGEVRGGPLLSSTAQLALPIAGLVCAGALASIKQRYRARQEHDWASFRFSR